MISEKRVIRVLTEDDEDISRSALPNFASKVVSKSVEIANDVLADNLEDFFKSFQTVLARLPDSSQNFTVDEVQLTLSIGANGGIELVGKVTGEVVTGMVFILKRKTN